MHYWFLNKGWKVLHIDDHMSDGRSGRGPLPLQGWSCAEFGVLAPKCAALRTQTHVCRPSPEQAVTQNNPFVYWHTCTHIMCFISPALTWFSGILWLFFLSKILFLVCLSWFVFELHFFPLSDFRSSVTANLFHRQHSTKSSSHASLVLLHPASPLSPDKSKRAHKRTHARIRCTPTPPKTELEREAFTFGSPHRL